VFFDSWYGLVRVVVAGTLAYVALVVLLRVSGNRTLSKMNAFDLIVTVALGSTLATILLTNDVALAEGIVALALLIGLQMLITWASVRSSRISRFVKSEPILLAHNGRLLHEQMRRARVVEAEIEAALREQGQQSLTQVAVVLETDGTFSIIPTSGYSNTSMVPSLERVRRVP
jgi:uncharacterized membrane protein YcaP (DUF421 family)